VETTVEVIVEVTVEVTVETTVEVAVPAIGLALSKEPKIIALLSRLIIFYIFKQI
jgi:hypothetical protein